MYAHFCCQLPCKLVYGIRTDDPLKTPVPKCTVCGGRPRRSGTGAKSLRKGAIEITEAMSSRPQRKAAKVQFDKALRHQKQMDARNREHMEFESDEESGDEDEGEEADEDNFLPTPEHGYNIHMRLTPGPYQARATYGSDATFRLNRRAGVLGTAGRLNLNKEMGELYGYKPAANYAAWRHAGTTRYSKDKFKSSEWCHLIADSLGGPSVPDNLVAASFSANTYMAALEVLLKGQATLVLDVTVHCSSAHIGEWIVYNIQHTASHKVYTVQIDGQAAGFNATDLRDAQRDLHQWLKGCGIKVTLPS